MARKSKKMPPDLCINKAEKISVNKQRSHSKFVIKIKNGRLYILE